MIKSSYLYYERAMPPDFCDYVVKSLDWSHAGTGTTRDESGAESTRLRRVKILPEHLMSPLGSVCKNYMIDANSRTQWSKSICGFDVPQILKYETTDHYWWHHDVLPPVDGKQRRVSLCMLLNDPSEFEGGQLELKDTMDNALKNKGDIIVFDSTTMHRVAPVTKGVRISAVCWAYGFYED